MYENKEEYKKEIFIESINYKLHELDIRKYDLYKKNPKIFGKFGGVNYRISDLDIILSVSQEERYLDEELNYSEYEDYENDNIKENRNNSIDPSDIEEYDRVKSIYYMNIDLEDIVKCELKNFSGTTNHREYKKVIMNLVRNNSKYKDLKNKKQLSSCVTMLLNKTDILYTFNLTQRVYEIFLESCNKNFDLVEDLLSDLNKDIDGTIDKLENTPYKNGLNYVDYVDKLKCVQSELDKMIEYDYFKEDANLKDDLLKCLENRKSLNRRTTSRKYKSEVRTSRKESIRSKALELKNEGIKNNEIARRLGKSKGYISELLNGKK